MRIHSFLDMLYRDHSQERVLIVAHGHWLVLLQKILGHLPIEEALRRYKEAIPKNASVMTYNSTVTTKLTVGLNGAAPWEGKL
jgi:broad specificity phosphatase PhoE